MINRIKNNKGVSLIELLIVLTIIGIITGFGIPEYGRYVAKSRVREAATALMQNMRMVRTMAIKENRTYIITLDPVSNRYIMGVDINTDGDLADPTDVYGQGPVRTVNIQTEYGDNVALGESNFTNVTPTQDPDGVALSSQSSFSFLPDSSTDPNGKIFFQHVARGYTFCVEIANTAGKTNLYIWQGDINNTGVTTWTELR